MTARSPTEPPPSPFRFPDPETWGPDDCVAVGADLAPGTLLQAYRNGLFPMHLPDGRLGWWSPSRRGVIPLDALRVSRSLRRSVGRYSVTVDQAFEAVIEACADPRRDGSWINEEISAAYTTLHRLGWAHSVEAWDGRDLVGGFYGVAIGGAFFGESMFYRATDASKVTLVRFVEAFRSSGGMLLDVQWATDHLVRLGAIEIRRDDYLACLRDAVRAPAPGVWGARDNSGSE